MEGLQYNINISMYLIPLYFYFKYMSYLIMMCSYIMLDSYRVNCMTETSRPLQLKSKIFWYKFCKNINKISLCLNHLTSATCLGPRAPLRILLSLQLSDPWCWWCASSVSPWEAAKHRGHGTSLVTKKRPSDVCTNLVPVIISFSKVETWKKYLD
jgi:hypothetical protein